LPCPPDAPAKVERFVRTVVRPGDRLVLDVGCGTGILLGCLLDMDGGCHRVIEVDVAEEMLRENRRKWAGERVERVCAEALRLPFLEGSFDLVLCFGILPHLGPAGPALAGLLRCLRPGGSLAVGHLMGSHALNAFHASLDGPVNQDQLLPADTLSAILEDLGASVLRAEERPDWYLLQAEKREG
jgi:SAM-dependent methyltransferase